MQSTTKYFNIALSTLVTVLSAGSVMLADNKIEMSGTKNGRGLDAVTGVRAQLENQLAALSHVICHERIARFSKTRGKVRQLDVVDADIEMAGGVERYSSIRSGRKAYPAVNNLSGAWSYGEFSTILDVTSKELARQTVSRSKSFVDEIAAELFTFQNAESAGKWNLTVASRTYAMPFTGRVWVSQATGDILRIEWQASNLPEETGLSKLVWRVDFRRDQVAGQDYFIPYRAFYSVAYRGPGDREDFNMTHFSQFQRYGSEIALRFD
jgi:hypothetical protein